MWKYSQLHNNFRKIVIATENPEIDKVWQSIEYWCWQPTLRLWCPSSMSMGVKRGVCILWFYGLDIVYPLKISVLKVLFPHVIVLESSGMFERWKKLVITNFRKRLVVMSCNGLEFAEIKKFPLKQVWNERMSIGLSLSCHVNPVLFYLLGKHTLLRCKRELSYVVLNIKPS